jgi:hypothetical protein
MEAWLASTLSRLQKVAADDWRVRMSSIYIHTTPYFNEFHRVNRCLHSKLR